MDNWKGERINIKYDENKTKKLKKIIGMRMDFNSKIKKEVHKKKFNLLLKFKRN
jgi:hypothetical protein